MILNIKPLTSNIILEIYRKYLKRYIYECIIMSKDVEKLTGENQMKAEQKGTGKTGK